MIDEILKVNGLSIEILDKLSYHSNLGKDNYHYPIEVQFNTLYDRQINNWLHAYVYKKGYQNEVGKKMREAYDQGRVRNVDEFEEVLKDVLYSCKR